MPTRWKQNSGETMNISGLFINETREAMAIPWRARLSFNIERGQFVKIAIEQEEDGRWINEIPDLPGVMAYGQSREEAIAKVEALAFRVIADRLEHGEDVPDLRLEQSGWEEKQKGSIKRPWTLNRGKAI